MNNIKIDCIITRNDNIKVTKHIQDEVHIHLGGDVIVLGKNQIKDLIKFLEGSIS